MANEERRAFRAPGELVSIVCFTAAIFLVVLIGSMIVQQFNAPSPWVFAAAYAIPSGIAFAIYWLIARRL